MNKFGVEIEIRAFDGRDFFNEPLRRGESPSGIKDVAAIISDLGLETEVQPWAYNHNNSKWICKPDASCGIEICSPVLNYDNLNDIFLVVEAISQDERVRIDKNCSFHVHADVDQVENIFNSNSLCSILVWWIKCEHVFLDFATKDRKRNRYCRAIGDTELFDHEEKISTFRVVSKLSDKYLTLNTFHLFNKKRWTVEFRLGEGAKDVVFVKNWLALINQFLDATKSKMPDNYRWLECSEVFEFLKFREDQKDLKIWFLNRLIQNCDISTEIGKYSHAQYCKIMDNFGINQSQTNDFRS